MAGRASQSHKDSFHVGHYTACSDSVADAKDAFARNVARMTQQLLRYREHDWRPVQYRDALAATAPARLEEREEPDEPKPRSRMLVRRPGSLSAEERKVVASTPDPPGMSGAELLQALLKECTLGKQQLCGAGSPAPSHSSSSSRLPEQEPVSRERHTESKKELELQTELNESRRALEKMALMLHDREEQLRLAEKRPAVQAQATQATQASQAIQAAAGSPPPKMSPRMAAKESIEQIEQCVRERAKCEVLRAELAERDVEIQRLRASERATEQRAAEELHCARLELAETRRQQESWLKAWEILGLEIHEAELLRQRPRPLLELLGLPPKATPEAKRERLAEAVATLKLLVEELTAAEAPEREACFEAFSGMPPIPEEDSQGSMSPCSPDKGTMLP
ncbi:unnamed protein product [Symbiodinium sp. CCMP2456]|nr:unnamed protein product [Symbiodinium sp. CCMP2456]